MMGSQWGERGVSPVIGVVLLVAITVVMATVLSTFVLGFADFDEQRPMVGFEFRYSPTGGLTITHTYGEAVDAAALRIQGSDPDGAVPFGDWPTTGTVTPGDSVTLPDVDGDETVLVVWTNPGRSFVLAKWTGPGATGGGSPSIPAPTPTPTPAPLDPGFAYEDVNGDTAYQDGTDNPVTRSDLEDGFSTSEQLVVPDSVGTITAADGTTISSDGMYFAATLEVTNSGSMNGATLDAGSGELRLAGATIDNRRDQTTTRLTGGGLDLDSSTVSGNGRVEIETSGELSMAGTTVTSIKDDAAIEIRSTGGGIDARNADVSGKGTVTVEGVDDVLLRDASVRSTKDQKTITVESTGGAVDARNADIAAKGEITVDAATDLLFQDGSAVISKRGAYAVSLASSTGDVRLDRATLDSGDGNAGPNNRLTATVSSGHVIDVTDARFYDGGADDDLDVTPDGAATGTPASGSVS